MSLSTALTVLFVGLKLAGVISWSWWLVTAPVWGLFPVFFVLYLLKELLS